MIYLRVLLNFASSADHALQDTTGRVLTSLYGNGNFTKPPVDQATLQTGLTTLTTAIAAQKQGGTAATAAKRQARAALIALLRQLAMYVQSTVQANPAFGLAELLSTGFEAASTTHTSHLLVAPIITKISNPAEGQLKLSAKRTPYARNYEAQYQIVDKDGPGQWVSAGVFSSTRDIVIAGLTPGTMYTLQLRAIGSMNSSSPWSDAVNHRSL